MNGRIRQCAKQKTIRRIIRIVPAAILVLSAVIIGMVLKGVFAAKLDSADVRSNRTEQPTNAIAQAAILTGILFLL